MAKGVKEARIPAFLTLLILAVICASLPGVKAFQKEGNIKLLAVYHEQGRFSGSPANLRLEIEPGNGRVFIETIPLSKVDTQISTRFAKQMACKFVNMDCSKYDFFYTIKSQAGIVGGPSAGGAIAVLTSAMLTDTELKEGITITGTINSGELIGPVGSLKEKIDAAKMSGIDKVLIPAVQQELQKDNVTSIVEYGRNLGVEVMPVNTLAESMSLMTGKEYPEQEKEIEIPEEYKQTMKEVSDMLCQKSEELIERSSVFDLNQEKEVFVENVKSIQEAKNLTEKAEKAKEEKKYYSRASYCFSANLKARKVLYEEQKLEQEDIEEEMEHIRRDIETVDRELEKKKKDTITDLQTYMIVKERVLEANKMLETGDNNSQKLAYSTERLYSAETWSEFFNKGEKNYQLEEEGLKRTCENTLREVEERFQYLNLFFPGLLSDLKNNLVTAHEYYKQDEYALCIFIASRTKADANVLVTLLGVKEESLGLLADQKLKAAKRAITRQIEKGTFPILAYSYYEYATSLKETNKISALIYAEYALELSDLSIYLEPKEKDTEEEIKISMVKVLPVLLFIWGLVLGYLYAWIKGREKREESEAKKDRKGKREKGKKKQGRKDKSKKGRKDRKDRRKKMKGKRKNTEKTTRTKIRLKER